MSATDKSQTLDLPVRTRDGLSEERKSSIRHALQKYRARVLEQNMRELVEVIDEVELAPPMNWDGRVCSEEEAPEKRIDNLQDSLEFCFDPPDPTITTVRDFSSEDKRDRLIRDCRLDGVTHGEVDTALRNAWIEDVEKRMSTAGRAQVRPDSLPADLKYLMTLVRGICGPGLPQWRMFN